MFAAARQIVALSLPMLVSQLAGIGMSVADTVIAGHYATADLAAVAVGSGWYMSVVFALVGIIYAVAPIIAHHHGAQRHADIAPAFQQAVWMALWLSLPGVLLLALPDPLLAPAHLTPEVDAKTRTYMAALAAALPGALLFRAFQGLMNGIGKPRPVMLIALAGLGLHIALSWSLAHGHFGVPLGAAGCGVSTLMVNWSAVAVGLLYIRFSRSLAPYRPLAGWRAPQRAAHAELLRLGGPMAVSNFVEITSFTLIAVFIARLGADVVAGHRVIANINGVCFMLPLALASASMVLIGQSAGAGDWARARRMSLAGLGIGAGLSVLVGAALWLGRDALLHAYSGDPAVVAVARSLMLYATLFVFFDATHTVASFSLRGYKITLPPMIIHTVCFWGVGLGGGYWLAFGPVPGIAPMGAAGFWLMTLLATSLAGLLIATVLRRVFRLKACEVA